MHNITTGIKICGINDREALQASVAAGCDYVGLVFYPPSPRHVSFEQAARLREAVPASVKTVAVTVNAEEEILAEIITRVRPDILQLHGRETPERLQAIKARYPHTQLMKALPVRKRADIEAAAAYADTADLLLFDAPPPASASLPGGNGVSFDWEMLKEADIPLPWFLSGGLTPENVAEAMRESGARLVDVSSGVESAPGVKDSMRIRNFILAARGAYTA